MKDNIEIICRNYSPTQMINWKNTDLDSSSNKTLYLAKLYNPKNNRRAYFLSLYLLADERKEKFTLMLRGNLNYWFFQKISEKNLTTEQHKKGMDFIFTILDIKESKILDAKINNFKIEVELKPNFREDYSINHQKIL